MEYQVGQSVRIVGSSYENNDRIGKVVAVDDYNIQVSIDGETFFYARRFLRPAASDNNDANFDDVYHGTVEGFALNSAFGAIESEMQKQIDDLQAQLDAARADNVTLTARNQQLQGDLKAAQAIIVNAGKQAEALRRAANDVYQLEGSTDPTEIAQRHEALMFLVNGL